MTFSARSLGTGADAAAIPAKTQVVKWGLSIDYDCALQADGCKEF